MVILALGGLPQPQAGDRPDVVPRDALNFAFIGQFAESKQRDCIFTTEYSVRTPMEAVYTLLNVERGVPEVFNSTYDIRSLLAATGRPIGCDRPTWSAPLIAMPAPSMPPPSWWVR